MESTGANCLTWCTVFPCSVLVFVCSSLPNAFEVQRLMPKVNAGLAISVILTRNIFEVSEHTFWKWIYLCLYIHMFVDFGTQICGPPDTGGNVGEICGRIRKKEHCLSMGQERVDVVRHVACKQLLQGPVSERSGHTALLTGAYLSILLVDAWATPLEEGVDLTFLRETQSYVRKCNGNDIKSKIGQVRIR